MNFVAIAICLVAITASQARILRHPMVTLMDAQHDLDSRIISGEHAVRGQIPWQAALTIFKSDGSYLCGGSLISDEWVITAGHCALNAISVEVQLGVTKWDIDMSEILISTQAQTHENYDQYYLTNDVALIKLPRKVAITDSLKPIRLPTRSEASDLLANKQVTASGFGYTANNGPISPYLNYVQLRAIPNAECAYIYGPSIISSSICAVGNPQHSTCSGDSGGPLVLHEEGKEPSLVGVVSFVHIAGCDSGNPSGYARVSSFLDWINKKTGIAIQD